MLALFVISRFFVRFSGRWAAIIGKQFSDEFGATFGDKLRHESAPKVFSKRPTSANSLVIFGHRRLHYRGRRSSNARAEFEHDPEEKSVYKTTLPTFWIIIR